MVCHFLLHILISNNLCDFYTSLQKTETQQCQGDGPLSPADCGIYPLMMFFLDKLLHLQKFLVLKIIVSFVVVIVCFNGKFALMASKCAKEDFLKF